jgi:hypothetical protein
VNSRKTKKSARSRAARRLMFDDLSLMGGIFTADLKRAREWVPSGRRPIVIAPGTALACVFCMEYRKSGIGPYGEVAVAIPLEPAGSFLPGSLSAFMKFIAGGSDVFIAQLPVTTERARSSGVSLMGLPKFTAEISFRETVTHRICTLRDRQSLELILEFDVKKCASGAAWMKFPWRHAVNIDASASGGALAVMDFVLSEWGAVLPLSGIALRWGRDPRAAEWKKLGWGVPLMGIHAPGAKAELTLTDRRGIRVGRRE